MSSDSITQDIRRVWDSEAAVFDQEPDHGLRDPMIRKAWKNRLADWLPPAPSAVLDIGCGTGSLSILIAELGHRVTGADISRAMLTQTQAKTAAEGHHINCLVMDAANPALAPQQFDALVCRHSLWALPEPPRVLQSWKTLLKPKARIVLVEGYWYTQSGLHAAEVLAALPSSVAAVSTASLSGDSVLWGREVAEERYVVTATFSG